MGGAEAYSSHPYVACDGIERLLRAGIGLFGVDTPNADDKADLERPAHTLFPGQGIHIVENLRGLGRLKGAALRFHAIPLPVRDAAAFPVRVFAAPIQSQYMRYCLHVEHR